MRPHTYAKIQGLAPAERQKYLTPSGRPRKRWVTIPVTGRRKPERWLLDCYTLDTLHRLCKIDQEIEQPYRDAMVVIEALTSLVEDRAIRALVEPSKRRR